MNAFEITYLLTVLEGQDIEQKIESLCLEQSVELPRSVLDQQIEHNIVGKPVARQKVADKQYEVTIAWPISIVGGEISHFLNILYGNISLQSGIKVIDADWSVLSKQLFNGSAYGIPQIRKRYQVANRPLSATALKPLGSDVSQLATYCEQFALGGIDIIKDDHGLADQEMAPFTRRVESCVAAISRAADQTGRRSYYFPNITASVDKTLDRYRQAADLGADGVLVCPHISGLGTMHRLAQLDIDLPIIAHPAFSGQLTTHPTRGMGPDFLYGQLWRALGADFIIYPNKGGRFSFSKQQCKSINKAARTVNSPFNSSFPMPGGGMELDTLHQWIEIYGEDTVFLIGGSLYEHPGGIQQASQEFRELLTPN